MKRRYFWAVLEHGHLDKPQDEKAHYGYAHNVNGHDGGYDTEEEAIAGYLAYLEEIGAYSNYRHGLILLTEYVPE